MGAEVGEQQGGFSGGAGEHPATGAELGDNIAGVDHNPADVTGQQRFEDNRRVNGCTGGQVADSLGQCTWILGYIRDEVGEELFGVAGFVEVDHVAVGECDPGVGECFLQRLIVDDDVDGRVGKFACLGGAGGSGEDRDQRIEVALALGSREGVGVGVVAVFGFAVGEVGLQLTFGEALEHGGELGCGEWVASGCGEVDGAVDVVDPGPPVLDAGVLFLECAVLIGQTNDDACLVC